MCLSDERHVKSKFELDQLRNMRHSKDAAATKLIMAGVENSSDEAAFPGYAAEEALAAAALLEAADRLWRTELTADEKTEALDVADADASDGLAVSVVAVAADDADVASACFALVAVAEAPLAVAALVVAEGTMGSSNVTLGINGIDMVAGFPDAPSGSEKSPV